jgi:ABC-type Mn2+/Zn2+ transport system ATPase subunit
MKTPAVICKQVCIGYDGADVVRNVSLTIESGSFLPVVGLNGAGKTTLLRAILGLLSPRRGSIQADFGGRPAGYVPQQRVIDPMLPLSVRQLVAMGLHGELGFWRRPSSAQRARLDQALQRLDLLPHADKTFAELSGGMKQKTLVARALVSNAEVYIMDEPTSELDAGSEWDVLSTLHQLSQDGKTVLIAHHGLGVIGDLAKQVCLMEHGGARLTPVEEMRQLSMPGPPA